MENKIENLKISNFKSIKELNISCKKINVFIGKPNVGKSNILEAISLLNPINTNFDKNSVSQRIQGIRFEQIKDLYHFKNSKTPIIVESNIGSAALNYIYHADSYVYRLFPKYFESINQILDKDQQLPIDELRNDFQKKSNTLSDFDENKNPKKVIEPYFISLREDGLDNNIELVPNSYNPVKFYHFRKNFGNFGNNRFYHYLLPPYGINLLAVMENQKELMSFCQEKFQEYNLQLGINKESNVSKLEIIRFEKPYIFSIPYSSISDTLQRMIFHHAAIISNNESIILFEEPETHSFPPYIKELAETIAEDDSNQYFIATHSPFILNTIIENTSLDNLNLFKVSYDNHQTSVYQYNENELSDLLNFGEDIFFNL